MADGADFNFIDTSNIDVPTDGYDIADIDLSSVAGSNAALMQAAAGMGGNVSGVGPSDSKSYGGETAKERQKRLTTQALLNNIQQQIQKLEKRANQIRDRLTQLDTLIEQLTEQIQETRALLSKKDESLAEAKAQTAEMQDVYDSKVEQLYAAVGRLDGTEAGAFVNKVIEIDEKFAMVAVALPGMDENPPRSYVVFKDENDRFFVNHPDPDDPQGRYYLDEIENADSEFLNDDVLSQIKKGDRLGNTATDEELKKIKELDTEYPQYLIDIKELDSTIRDKLFADYKDIKQLRVSLFRQEKIIEELEKDIEHLKTQLEGYESDLQGYKNERSALENELANIEKQLEELNKTRDELEQETKDIGRLAKSINDFDDKYSQLKDQGLSGDELRTELEKDIPAAIVDLLIEQKEIDEDVEETHTEIAQNVQEMGAIDESLYGYKDRHEMNQKHYGGLGTNWSMFNANKRSFIMGSINNRKFDTALTQERALNFAEANPDHKLTQAWENVLRDDDNNVVYQSNEDGRLYTINAAGEQVFKTDIEEIYALRQKIGAGTLTGNESPFEKYHSKFDSFNETSQAILTAEELKKYPEAREKQLQKELEELNSRRQEVANEINKHIEAQTGVKPAPITPTFEGCVVEKVQPLTMPANRDKNAGKLRDEKFTPAAAQTAETPEKPAENAPTQDEKPCPDTATLQG